ncbi:cytoskeleton-associated protein 2-like [Rhinoderma darwinii]|uniref:cytoskeleton-associated protein 2-like n=1 Tax=Rhinoderma darwinii TaxID=43563 RepID=UPI003F6815DC
MEAMKRRTAEEERRFKLLEYLAAKGKPKPQNNCKTYLKDCTNLQNTRPKESSKQICETKKNASHKGSHFAFESNPSQKSSTGCLPHKSNLGKIPTQQSVSAKNKTLSTNPLPPKCSLPRVRPDRAGRTLPPSTVLTSHTKKEVKSEGSDITLTVILTKKQLGKKPEIRVKGKTSPTMRGQHAPRLGTTMPSKSTFQNREWSVSQPKQMPVAKTIAQATKTKSLHDPQPSAGKSMSNSGHIRIVSRLSLPGAKSQSANERSFLIKSSRNDGPKQPLNVRKEPLKGSTQNMTCSTKRSSAAQVTTSSTTAHKKTSTAPVSAPNIRPRRWDCSSNRMSNTQNTKQMASRKSTGPNGCNKIVDRSKVDHNKLSRVGENKHQGVTGATKETTTKPSSVTDTDATSRPQTPRMTEEDRKKKLQDWLNSKGRSYKRPSMKLPAKRPPTVKKQDHCNGSLWEGIEEEEELLSLSRKISQTLSECLELIQKGISKEDVHVALDNVPEAKKFAMYWVCKARLLEREGICDVMDVYKQGVQFGATPIEELRDVVLDIMKNTNKKTKVVTFGPLPAEEMMENENHEDIPLSPITNCTEEVKAHCPGTSLCGQGSAVKLQITSLSSKKFPASGQEWKRLTPVRRSVRIHHSASQYPEMVQERDTVVSSLEELLDQVDTDAYLYMRNDALPEEADHNVMSLIKKDPTEGQHERPV